MAEQRLIDANKIDTKENGNNSQRAMWLKIRWLIEKQPTIDPETLPIVRQLREELTQYKDLGVTPEQIALLMKFFKDRTSAKWIAADMELVADSIRKSNLEKQLARVTAERDKAVKTIEIIMGCQKFCALCGNSECKNSNTRDASCNPIWNGLEE